MKEEKTMKKYIKPNTEMYAVELQKMIADSGDQQQVVNRGDLGSSTSGFTFGGKETEISTPSLWDEEE